MQCHKNVLIRIPAGPHGPNWPNKLATSLCSSNEEAAGVTGDVKAKDQRKKKDESLSCKYRGSYGLYKEIRSRYCKSILF